MSAGVAASAIALNASRALPNIEVAMVATEEVLIEFVMPLSFGSFREI